MADRSQTAIDRDQRGTARIVFLDVDPHDEASVRARFPNAAIHKHLQPADVGEACKDADVVSFFITTPFRKPFLATLPNLKLLSARSVGFDHVDVDACRERGIIVCNVPDYGSHVIAEHVFALLLSKIRHIPEGDARVQGGTFDYHGLRGISLRGKTLGIVGTGKIGRRVAQIAHGFGMQILATDRCRTVELADLLGVRYVSLQELFAGSDFITLHAPATKDTEHMVNAAAFAAMKQGVILINTARGSLIDSKALLDALQSGRVHYALLDVLEHEQNFQEFKALIDHPHVVVTPHTAFYTDESMRNMYEDAFASIEQWIRTGNPEHVVHPLKVVCDLPGIRKP